VTVAHGTPSIAVVMPCLDDWNSLSAVLQDLDQVATQIGNMTVVVVDDGSSEHPAPELHERSYNHLHVSVTRLECNLGHQRALCIGISEALTYDSVQRVVLMDSDGEDRPRDIQALITGLDANNVGAAVAERRSRQSGTAFRFLNRIFQWMFRILTGRTLNFGNFMALTRSTATRLSYTPDTWNNIPTSLMRSRVAILRIPIDRGARHDGDSRLGLVGLINHGLGALSVYADVVFTRIIVASAGALGISALIGVAAVVTRVTTGAPLPGWFALGTTAIALSSLLLLVSVTLLIFVMLSSARAPAPPPVMIASSYIAHRWRLGSHVQGTTSPTDTPLA